MWNDLTMQQRADVISMAVKAGMRDMRSIRSFYDEALGSRRFDDGGHMFDGNSEPINALYKPEDNVVHKVTRVNGDLVGMDPDTGKFYDNITGDYIGDHVALDEVVVTPKKSTIVDTIRERLRKGINPASSYDNPIGRVLNAVILGGTDYSADRDPYADAAWDKYLGFANDKITESKYKPTKGDSNQKYYTYDDLILSSYVDPVLGKNYTEDSNREFINEALNLKVGDTALGNQPPVLNDFTYSHGHDRKGDYISVYDKYDINPFKDIINTGDLSLGVGKPFELYDRLYLDDHYGVEGKYKGASYLPEVKIESYRRQPKAKTISN